jgi:hypothetical protein
MYVCMHVYVYMCMYECMFVYECTYYTYYIYYMYVLVVHIAHTFNWLIYDPEDKSSKFTLNVGSQTNYTALYPLR